jgi:hypothetical protein
VTFAYIFAQDCVNWVVLKSRAVALGTRVRWHAFDAHRDAASAYYVMGSLHFLRDSLDLLIPSVLALVSLSAQHAFSRIAWSLPLWCLSILLVSVALWRCIQIGDFRRIMEQASFSPEATEFLLNEMELGIRNPQIYRLLRQIYEPHLDALNQSLKLEPDAKFRFLDIKTAEPFSFLGVSCEDSRHYAAIYSPLSHGGFRELAIVAEPYIDRGGKLSPRVMKYANGRQSLVRRIRSMKSGQNFHDVNVEGGPNFVVQEIRKRKNALQLVLATAQYGHIMRTCDCLVEEVTLLGRVLGDRQISTREALWFMPIRRMILKFEGLKALLSPTIRRAGLGISALTALVNKDGDYEVIIGRRSRRVSTYMNAWHVIPAGMCNTHDDKFDDAFLMTTIQSEFLEEVFSMGEWENYQGRFWRRAVKKKVDEVLREAGMRVADADLLPTAISFDLLNLRPEVCVLFAVHNPAFLDKFIDKRNNKLGISLEQPNYEWANLANPKTTSALPVTESVQAGACAYYEGLRVLQELAAQRAAARVSSAAAGIHARQ